MTSARRAGWEHRRGHILKASPAQVAGDHEPLGSAEHQVHILVPIQVFHRAPGAGPVRGQPRFGCGVSKGTPREFRVIGDFSRPIVTPETRAFVGCQNQIQVPIVIVVHQDHLMHQSIWAGQFNRRGHKELFVMLDDAHL